MRLAIAKINEMQRSSIIFIAHGASLPTIVGFWPYKQKADSSGSRVHQNS